MLKVLLYKQRITAHSVTALVAFYACAIIVHAHFRIFPERPVVIMLPETLHGIRHEGDTNAQEILQIFSLVFLICRDWKVKKVTSVHHL